MTRGDQSDTAVGVLLVSADRATIAEWNPRRVEELESLELRLTEAEEHELVGPSYSHPRGSGEKALATTTSAQRDLWERRLEDHRTRFARSAAIKAALAAKQRGWSFVLVLGDPRRSRPAREELQRRRIPAVASNRVLQWLRPAALAKRLAPDIERARAELAAPNARS
jgi:Bacterial archaeo-eukaryotic release factor family 10